MDKIIIDIGGTKMSAGILRGSTVERFCEVRTPAQEGPKRIVDVALDLIGDLLDGATSLHVAVAGLVRDGQVTTLNPATFPGWEGFPLQSVLEDRTKLETVVMNDAHAATWGEYLCGAGRSCHTFAFITVSTGIGGGLVVNGRPLVGATGLAGHLGLSLPQVGSATVLESIASGTAIAKLARSDARPTSTAKDVFAAAVAGESWAQALLEEVAESLALALANLKVLVDPELIAVGGGVGLAQGFIDTVTDALSRMPRLYHVQLVPAQLANHAGLIGAGLWNTS